MQTSLLNKDRVSLPTRFAWEKPAPELALKPDEIHIWKVDLGGSCDKDSRRLLSTGEIQREARLVRPEDRRKFTCGRVALRKILASYLGLPPADIRFGYGRKGKPYLLDPQGSPRLEFSLSHSAHLMLVACACSTPVGIDLEFIQPIDAREQILRQYFCPQDGLTYHDLPDFEKEAAFMSAWTIREACSKVHGAGLAEALQEPCFPSDLNWALPEHFYAQALSGAYRILRFTPQAGFTAAVALEVESDFEPVFYQFLQKDNLAIT
jgi:4'-phosphopantetheinyl transferase